MICKVGGGPTTLFDRVVLETLEEENLLARHAARSAALTKSSVILEACGTCSGQLEAQCLKFATYERLNVSKSFLIGSRVCSGMSECESLARSRASHCYFSCSSCIKTSKSL